MNEPLHITATLQSAVVSDQYLPLDGVLLAVAMRERYGNQAVTAPLALGAEPLIDLPIDVIEHGSDWWYAASFVRWNGAIANGQDYWNKRFDNQYADLIDFGKRRGKVIVEQGQYKAYHTPIYYRHALSLSWCVRGDADAIRGWLRFVTNIGKKTDQGWGAILRWDVEAADSDWSQYHADGTPSRALPAANGVTYGIRPPYWYRAHQVPCVLPS
jgi:CRISPR type IV-associated protein Csf3